MVDGSRAYLDHLLLRDYRRAHPEAVAAYAALKLASAARFRDDRDAYQAAKQDFIEVLIRRAEADQA